MTDLNSVCLTGRLTRPAEWHSSQASGGGVCRFSLAVNRRKRTADGAWEDEANYFDCIYFARSADGLVQYLTQGRQVAVMGELRQSRWEQDGQKRSRVEIAVNQITLVGSRNDGQGGAPQGQWSGSPAGSSFGQQNQQSARPAGGADTFAPSNQNRFSGSYSRPSQGEPVANDFSVGGPESYGDDDVPF